MHPVFSRTFWPGKGIGVDEVVMLLSIGGDGTFLDSVVYVKDSETGRYIRSCGEGKGPKLNFLTGLSFK